MARDEVNPIVDPGRVQREASLLTSDDVCAEILAYSVIEYTHAERAHASIYPVAAADPAIDAMLRGPAVPAAACPSYAFVSERAGEAWSQRFRYGLPDGPPVQIGSTAATGSTITFETAKAVDHARFAALVDALRSRIPGLVITLRTGDSEELPRADGV